MKGGVRTDGERCGFLANFALNANLTNVIRFTCYSFMYMCKIGYSIRAAVVL